MITSQKKKPFFIAVTIWLIFDLLILLPVQRWLNGTLPVFTFVWLLPPLIALIISQDPGRIGIRRVAIKTFLPALGLNGLGVFLIMLLFEPWSQAYQTLVRKALESPTPDTTFAWLIRFPGWPGFTLMFIYTGLVTIFAEELFFRGWLLQWLARKMPVLWAILLQALLFSLPQALAALFLKPVQALVYLACYSFVAIGLVGGWADWQTKSVWPSLITATLMNLIIVVIMK